MRFRTVGAYRGRFSVLLFIIGNISRIRYVTEVCMIKFGPSGNSLSFYESGGKSTVEAMKWVADMGLTAY